MKKLTNWIRQAHKFLAQFLDDIRSWSLGEGKRLRLKDGEKPVVLDAPAYPTLLHKHKIHSEIGVGVYQQGAVIFHQKTWGGSQFPTLVIHKLSFGDLLHLPQLNKEAVLQLNCLVCLLSQYDKPSDLLRLGSRVSDVITLGKCFQNGYCKQPLSPSIVAEDDSVAILQSQAKQPEEIQEFQQAQIKQTKEEYCYRLSQMKSRTYSSRTNDNQSNNMDSNID